MIITVAGIAIGLVIGLARGGRVRNLTRVEIRWATVGILGVVGLLVIRWGDHAAPELMLATALSLCAACALRNWRIVGLGVVGVGLLANLAPLLVNGTVPVDPDALVHADLVDRDDLEEVRLGGGRAVADDTTALAALGQRIPLPELGVVLSFGDLVVAVGLADAVHTSLRRRRPGGLPVAEIFAADERARGAAGGSTTPDIDLTSTARRARRERPVEVSPGRPVPIPVGWGPVVDDDAPVGGIRPRLGRSGEHRSAPSTHVPWPWRRTPPPRPHHPTMRVTRR